MPPRVRQLLAVDIVGAALTAAITLGVLASGWVESGVPRPVWWVLGGLALGMCGAGAMALRRPSGALDALRRLAWANLIYAAMSVAVVLVWRDTVAGVVAAYVFVELLVLLALAVFERREAARPSWN